MPQEPNKCQIEEMSNYCICAYGDSHSSNIGLPTHQHVAGWVSTNKIMNSVTIFSIISAVLITTVAANSFETISDDDLVERIKSNEYLIVLFCKYEFIRKNHMCCDEWKWCNSLNNF